MWLILICGAWGGTECVRQMILIPSLAHWSLYKYKCLWSIGGTNQDSSLEKGVSHTYILRLGYSKISILYQKRKRKKSSLKFHISYNN